MTADVDVTVELDPVDIAGFIEPLARRGFELRVTDPEDFVKATSVLPFVHTRSGMPLDVVVAGSELEALFLDRPSPKRDGSAE